MRMLALIGLALCGCGQEKPKPEYFLSITREMPSGEVRTVTYSGPVAPERVWVECEPK